MITDLCSDKIKWTKRANDEMGLDTMIDDLYKMNIISELTCLPLPHEPKNKDDDFLFRTLYDRHNDLLLDMIEILFPIKKVFTPSQINKKGSSEFFLFHVIHEIYDITWYQEIEKSRPRGYEKEKKKLEEAEQMLVDYSESNLMNVTKYIHFPKHQNETILTLSEFLKKYRPRQEEKIIKAIKDHFKIKSLKDTKEMGIVKANRKMEKNLNKKGYVLPPLFKTNF